MSGQSIGSVSIKDLSLLKALQMIIDLQIETTQDLKRINVHEARQILHNYENKLSGRQKLTSTFHWDIARDALQEDEHNRHRLTTFYEKTKSYVHDLPKVFNDNLKEIFPDLEKVLQEHIKQLKDRQVVFLVAGDEGSGKSSLVNLLLGKELLPTNSIRCTSAIVEIRHGTEPAAIIHWREDSFGKANKPFMMNLDSFKSENHFLLELEKHIVLVDEETDETPYDVIQLYWPLAALKNGVTIVDSPGIVGSKGLPEHLSTYMEKAFGFIYVIDSTSSIHKERLGQLLLRATEANEIFDDSTALFVCNKWDSFSQDESEEVLDNIQRRLAVIIPDVRRNQLFPISIKEASKFVECDFMTNQYKQLLEGIRRFLPQAMKGKLRSYYRYLSAVLEKSLLSLRFSNSMHQKEQEEIKAYYQNVCDRISLLQSKAETRLEDLKKEVRYKTMDACVQIQSYFNSMHVSVKLTTWHHSQCPDRDRRWQNVAKQANLLISERVAAAVNSWEAEENVVMTFYQDVVRKFEEKLNLFGDSMKKVEGVFKDQEDIRKALKSNHVILQNAAPKKSAKPKTDNGYLSLGHAVGSAVVLDLKSKEIKKLFKDEYRDPAKVMETATRMALEELYGYQMNMALTKFFDRFMKGIDRVGTLVPDILKADKKLLQELASQLSTGQEKLDCLPYLLRKCSDIQGPLNMAYFYWLMVPDFTQDEIEFGETLGKGGFAVVYKAEIKHHSSVKTVAVKDPIEAMKHETVTDMLLEESMLRELNNKNIVKYYGFMKTGTRDRLKLALVMEFCPGTLKDQFVDKNESPGNFRSHSPDYTRTMDNIAGFIMQIADGLNYLHKKHIVHRDIKPENILLTENNVVRIADLGLAKDIGITMNVGTFYYMAPEVMFGMNKLTYDTKADIYSLAMVMWELWYGRSLIKYACDKLPGGVKRGWRPSITDNTRPDQFWENLIKKSWEEDPQLRPTASEIGDTLHFLRKSLLERKTYF